MLKKIGSWVINFVHNTNIPIYSNLKTQTSQIQKPLDVLINEKLQIKKIPFSVHSTKEGRNYYHNQLTKLSQWSVPPEVERLVSSFTKQAKAINEPLITKQKELSKKTKKNEALIVSSEIIYEYIELYARFMKSSDSFKELLPKVMNDNSFYLVAELTKKKHIFEENLSVIKNKILEKSVSFRRKQLKEAKTIFKQIGSLDKEDSFSKWLKLFRKNGDHHNWFLVQKLFNLGLHKVDLNNIFNKLSKD